MSKHRKGKLYIRRMKPGDTSDSFMTALQMSSHQVMCEHHGRKRPLVLVRHGFRGGGVMTVDYSRRELENRFFGRDPGPKRGGNRFKRLARRFKVKEAA